MFFIACISKIEVDDLGWPDFGSDRIVGFSESFEDAEDSVLHNALDIAEHLYWYAVIQEINPGLYPTVENEWWYRFNQERDGFDPMPYPDVLPENDGYYMF